MSQSKKGSHTHAAGAPEGTAVLSTGETGATKFLREDGDGTCSWATPSGSGTVTGTGADNQVAVWTAASTIEGTSSLVFDSTGLGIGTDSPATKLTIHDDTSTRTTLQIREDGTGDPSIWFTLAGNVTPFAMGVDNSSSDSFVIAGSYDLATSPRLTIDSAGSVGIGTLVPATGYKLDVQGDLSLGEAGGSDNSYIDQKQNGHLYIINSGSAGNAGRVGINKWNTLAGGTTYYRDFIVYDGKETALLTVDGSAGSVGIGTDAPKRHLQIYNPTDSGGGVGSSTYLQLTNLSTGAASDGDGFQLGLSNTGEAQVNQRENLGMVFSTNNTERLRIDSAGNVGIGTSSLGSGRRVTVAGGAIAVSGQNLSHSASNMVLGQDSTAVSQIRFYGADTSTAGILQFEGTSSDGSVGGERMRIDSAGLVGIGTSAAVNKLDVEGNIGVKSGQALRIYDAANSNYSTIDSPASGAIAFSTGGVADAAYITNAGNFGIGTSAAGDLLEVNGVGRSIGGGTNYNVAKFESTTTNKGGIMLGGSSYGANDSGVIFPSTSTGSLNLNVGSGGDTQGITISAAGLVGISTAVPTRPLHVVSTNSAAISTVCLENTGGGDASLWFKESSSEWAVGLDNSDSNNFKISNSSELGSNDRLFITTGGLVGIGGVTPTEELEVFADAPSVQLTSSNASGRKYGLQSDNTGLFAFYDGTAGANRLTISAAGLVGIGKTPTTVLDIADNGTGLRLSRGTVDLRLSDNATNGNIGTESNHDLNFRTNSADRMTISAAGTATFGGSVLTANNKQIGWRNYGDSANNDWILNGSDELLYRSGGTTLFRITDAGRVTVKKSSNSEIVDQASGTCDLSASNNYQVTIGGATTINLTSGTDGQSGVIKIVHDGSNVPTFTSSQIKWEGGTVPTPSTGSGDIDLIAYYVDGDIYGVYLKGMA